MGMSRLDLMRVTTVVGLLYAESESLFLKPIMTLSYASPPSRLHRSDSLFGVQKKIGFSRVFPQGY